MEGNVFHDVHEDAANVVTGIVKVLQSQVSLLENRDGCVKRQCASPSRIVTIRSKRVFSFRVVGGL